MEPRIAYFGWLAHNAQYSYSIFVVNWGSDYWVGEKMELIYISWKIGIVTHFISLLCCINIAIEGIAQPSISGNAFDIIRLTRLRLPPAAEKIHNPWWRHQLQSFSALLAICAWNSPVTGKFSPQRPVTRGFAVFFDLLLNKWLSKQRWGWWFETPSRPLWSHCNVLYQML